MKNWKIQKVYLADVKMNPNNPRSISNENLEGLKASLSRFGYVEPIVWNEVTGHIVSGHQRYSVLAENGVTEAMMVAVEMSVEDELAATINLNNPEIEGHWAENASDLLHQLEISDNELFSSLKMEALMSSLEQTPHEAAGQSDGFDTECPCCRHRWKIQAKDVESSEA